MHPPALGLRLFLHDLNMPRSHCDDSVLKLIVLELIVLELIVLELIVAHLKQHNNEHGSAIVCG